MIQNRNYLDTNSNNSKLFQLISAKTTINVNSAALALKVFCIYKSFMLSRKRKTSLNTATTYCK